jgi:DNA-binding XRE family transcriptional regulator
MIGNRVRTLRESLGLTQAELARRAGVSRQLVGALEAGRNLPRVDAALALAGVLGVDIAALFSPLVKPQDVISGDPPLEGSVVRVGVVGDKTVTSMARVGATGWDVADAEVERGELELFTPLRPGVVLAGCEPGLELLERLLREAGIGAMAVCCSSAAAVSALLSGRVHAAVVHASPGHLPKMPTTMEIARFHLCRWQVGLAAPRQAKHGWVQGALAGQACVIQREDGAAVQTAFIKAAERPAAGPRVGSHLEAARMAVETGLAAVTIEPAALALGAAFHALEIHEAELWVGRMWLSEPAVEAALVELSGRRFQRRLASVGGYDLEGCGISAPAA